MLELNLNSSFLPSQERCLFLSLAFAGTPSSDADAITMADERFLSRGKDSQPRDISSSLRSAERECHSSYS